MGLTSKHDDPLCRYASSALVVLPLVLLLAGLAACASRERGVASESMSVKESAVTCFFDGEICVVVEAQQTTVLGFTKEEVWWVDVRPLSNLSPNSSALLSTRKRKEDVRIYSNETHAFAEVIHACCAGDVVSFLHRSAENAAYAGSFWQHLTAVGGWARTRGAVSPAAWIAADPLVGTAGNGPDFVFPGVAFIGGDIAGSATTRIALAHDIDWSLGRYLGVGPLAPFLFPRHYGGGAPDRYTTALGLAGLGTVVCDPFAAPSTTTDDGDSRQSQAPEEAECDWFIFTTDAFGGPYARPFEDHSDWQVYAASSRVVGDQREACVEEGEIERCRCAGAPDATGTRRILEGGCEPN